MCVQGKNQPPSGGCVLKRSVDEDTADGSSQPPSGGCVLKLKGVSNAEYIDFPAAFGRLCVETLNN